MKSEILIGDEILLGLMRNWLLWAEEKWSSDRPLERYGFGLPVKLLVEGSIAFIIALLVRQIINFSKELAYFSYSLIPDLNGVVGTISFAIMFAALWCDLVRERNVN